MASGFDYMHPRLLIFLSATALATSLLAPAALAAERALFDGTSLANWQGDIGHTWRVRDGVIVGGSIAGNPRNEFLATSETFRFYRLTLEYRLVGTEGFVNGGVQFHSQWAVHPPNEMVGYQADIGAGFSGCLYDESRRNRMLAAADPQVIAAIEKPGDWNRYEIVCYPALIQLHLNGKLVLEYVEPERDIPREGRIALQIHGKCKAEISFRNLRIEEFAPADFPPLPSR